MKRLSLILIMLLTISYISGCNMGDNQYKNTSGTMNVQSNNKKINLYFTNKENSKMLKETREIFVEEDDDLVGAIINELLKGPVSADMKSAIPQGTELIYVKTDNNTAIVNFTKEYYNTENVGDIMAKHSIGRTLFELPDIERVQILVEGEEIKRPNGEPCGPLSRDDLVLELPSEQNGKTLLTLYFAGENAEYLVPEYRIIDVKENQLIEKRILQELIKGPDTEGLSKTIPVETKVLSVDTSEGVCFVNLSEEFKTKHSGGSTGEILTIYSIVNSLTELPHINEVQFLIDGKKVEVFKHLIFNESFVRDTTIIKK